MFAKLLMDALQGGSSSSKDDDSTSVMNVLRALNSVKNTVEAQSGLYSQLFQLEWEEQRRRYNRILLLLAIAFFSFGCFMVFAGVFFLVLIWDHELRNWYIGGMLCVYALVAIIAIMRIKSLQASWGRPFAAVRDELKADLDVIKSRL